MGNWKLNTKHKTFRNFHFNYDLPNQGKIKATFGTVRGSKERYIDAIVTVQEILKEASRKKKRLRPFGSRWSLSTAPYGKHWMLDNRDLSEIIDIKVADLHSRSKEKAVDLIIAQSGCTIKGISLYLQDRKRSLKTSGASNGQTIAGAISTGVHGSTLDFGSIQDFVHGIHIITSSTSSIYIERKSRRVLSDAFLLSLGVNRIERSNQMFNAALVSMGAFGYIHGVLIETEKRYLLEKHVIKLDRRMALNIGKKLDFKIGRTVLPKGGKRPFHYKLYINPYRAFDDYVCEIIYKIPYKQPYKDPIPKVKTSYYRDLPTVLGAIVSINSSSIKKIIDIFSGFIFPKEKMITGTLAELFFDTQTKSRNFGIAIGVDIKDFEQALMALNSMMLTPKNIPGLLSVRFVKGTKATLGFTRFTNTAIIEVDGIKWNGVSEFVALVSNLFENSNIDFTFHWGKNAQWTPKLVKRMYSLALLKSWKKQRSTIVPNKMRQVFASKFLDDCGLS